MNNFEKIKQDFNNITLDNMVDFIMIHLTEDACLFCSYDYKSCSEEKRCCLYGIEEYLIQNVSRGSNGIFE